MERPRQSSAERALEIAIFAPLGLGAKLVDEIPSALTQARQQVTFARFVGKMAVDQGVSELKSRLVDLSAPRVDDAIVPERSPGSDVDDPAGLSDSAGRSASGRPAISLEELALPDYDQLPAAHIVSKLDRLTAEELAVIASYEQQHRHRRTILGKIAQLEERK